MQEEGRNLTKEELENLLDSLEIPVSEGVPDDEDVESDVRICYWDYIWEDNVASGIVYNTNVTYQISFIANIPRHPKLLELKKKLNDRKLHPTINHEYVITDRRWHSYFSLEVIENV